MIVDIIKCPIDALYRVNVISKYSVLYRHLLPQNSLILTFGIKLNFGLHYYSTGPVCKDGYV